jgi:NAD(P)H-nitrite reductase large subunit
MLKQIAAKVTKNKKSKWFGIDPKDIEAIWNAESDRAMTLGTFIITKENLIYVL